MTKEMRNEIGSVLFLAVWHIQERILLDSCRVFQLHIHFTVQQASFIKRPPRDYLYVSVSGHERIRYNWIWGWRYCIFISKSFFFSFFPADDTFSEHAESMRSHFEPN